MISPNYEENYDLKNARSLPAGDITSLFLLLVFLFAESPL